MAVSEENRFYQIFETIKSNLATNNVPVDFPLLEKAYHFARDAHQDQLRLSGDPYFVHSLRVAEILAELDMDYVTIIGGLLHDVVEDTGVNHQELEEEFSQEIAQLVDGVTKIGELRFSSLEERQAENFRKMIIAILLNFSFNIDFS